MNMKLKLTLLGSMALLTFANVSSATLVINDNWTVNQSIPDGNPAGIALSQTYSGLSTGLGGAGINHVDVRLNISGGYNGDLYGYLVLQSADSSVTTAILLNRIGTGPGNAFGSSGSGFSSITLSDGGTANGNIHNATGMPTGFWQAGQLSGVTSLNTTFGGRDANGTWTLFLADMSGGDVSSLVSWGLEINVVPEPATWALAGFGCVLALVAAGRRQMRLAGTK